MKNVTVSEAYLVMRWVKESAEFKPLKKSELGLTKIDCTGPVNAYEFN